MPIVFKCKMCGGDLDVHEGATIVKCLYCGSKQTLPKIDDNKRRNLYERANYFRQNGDFDKAMIIYEQILSEDNTDAEAYWSLVLCRYGIEYVEDPATHQRVPTVNRTQPLPVINDKDYKMALNYADASQIPIYESEARLIDKIQHDILEISAREKPFDVFISYKDSDNNGQRTPDSVLAVDIYEKLTQEGFKVFCSRITLEDKIGQKYEPYIFAALNSAPVMIALGTRPEYFNAVWVRNEWSRYLNLIKNGAKKTLIPAFKNMSPYDLPDEFSHLQAQDMGKIGFMQDLVRGVKKLIRPNEQKTETVIISGKQTEAAPLLKRAFMFLDDGDFVKGNEYFERVLDIDPENGEAYLGKLMIEKHVRHREDLAKCAEPFDTSKNYKNAIRFGNADLISELEGYIAVIKDRIEQARIEAEQKAERERIEAEQIRIENEIQAKKQRKIMIAVFAVIVIVIVSFFGYKTYINIKLFSGSAQEVITAIKYGVDVNVKDNDGSTALIRAAREGKAENVKVLIDAGADVNAKDKTGYTALMIAADWGRAEIINILIDAGADVKIKNYFGKMAVDYAREEEELKGTNALKRLEELSR
ncbi:MAG: ankyrin repeat domain-containing protein [Synergistaceae bacterium]|nr:ankyrin repeat domain-containing protein [Synergistaceae bacterium]